jgi:hypothetical protein
VLCVIHLITLLITTYCSLRSEFPEFLKYVSVSVMSFWFWTGRKGLLRSILDFCVLWAWLVVTTLLVDDVKTVSQDSFSTIFGRVALSSTLFLFLSVWPMRYLSGLIGIELRNFDCSGPVTLSDVFFVTTLISILLGGMLMLKDVFVQHSELGMDELTRIVWSGFPIVIGLVCAIVYVPICRIVNILFSSKEKWPLRLFVGVHSLVGISAFLTISAWNFVSGYEGIAGIIMAEVLIFLSIVALNVVVRHLARNNAAKLSEIGE